MNFADLHKPPRVLGFDPDRLRGARELLETGIASHFYPACVYVILRHGLIANMGAMGQAQPDAQPPIAATLDTIFDLASLTKTFTATLLLQCVEDGLLHLNQEVRQHLPEAEHAPLGPITLRQLATHTSGLPAWKALYQHENGTPLAQILATPLAAEPGKQYTYSDLGYVTLGLILERVTGRPLALLARERIFAPLGMARSGYTPPASLLPSIAATATGEVTPPGKRAVGDVHDPNAYGMGGVAGHAGIFSSASDLVRYILSLRYPNAAQHHGIPRLLNPLAIRLTETRQTEPPLNAHTIGWFADPNGYLPRGDLLSPRTFGHSGFTGTLLMFDPEHDLSLLLLTNRVYYEKENDGTGLLRLRRLWANRVAAALLG